MNFQLVLCTLSFRIWYNFEVNTLFRYVSDDYLPASGAYVGLALPGEAGSWQTESKVIPFGAAAFWNLGFSHMFFSILLPEKYKSRYC